VYIHIYIWEERKWDEQTKSEEEGKWDEAHEGQAKSDWKERQQDEQNKAETEDRAHREDEQTETRHQTKSEREEGEWGARQALYIYTYKGEKEAERHAEQFECSCAIDGACSGIGVLVLQAIHF
jgi:hypothetical protein